MAVYKVIQDIEAEDKLVGPLTLKQFIFAGVALGIWFLGFMIASKTSMLIFLPFLITGLIPAILAAPLGRDQPTDIWLAAQIRFLIKPRKRIWDQSGIKNLVNITVPKKIEKIYSDGLSQQEVKSRLRALATTIDSHGWAAKNVDVNLYSTPVLIPAESDRLIDALSLPQIVPDVDINATDDIMDAGNNAVAQHFDEMMKESEQAHKAAAIEHMQSAVQNSVIPPAQQSYDPRAMPASVPDDLAMFGARMVTPINNDDQNSYLEAKKTKESSPDDEAMLKHIKDKKKHDKEVDQLTKAHHKVVKTPEEIAEEEAEKTAAKKAQALTVTPPKNPVIVNLANENELKISTIAGLANRKSTNNNGEVEIKLR